MNNYSFELTFFVESPGGGGGSVCLLLTSIWGGGGRTSSRDWVRGVYFIIICVQVPNLMFSTGVRTIYFGNISHQILFMNKCQLTFDFTQKVI